MWITASLSRLLGQCRIWNHRRQECVLKRLLTDDPVDLSLHCSGLMLLIAYSDRLQLLYILRYAQQPHQPQSPIQYLHLAALTGQLAGCHGLGALLNMRV